jgi:hypothetical protein
MKQLEDSQLVTFDTEYITEKRWKIIKEHIDRDLPDGEFSFLDVGGGNGMFADRILKNYPQCHGTVLDNSQFLLNRNKPNSRKKIICESVERLYALNEKFDIISMNWLLHHLVGDSYMQSRQNIGGIIETAISLLTERGKISIFDNMYNGLLFDGLPSYLIHRITSSKSISSITRKMGANTAGVGVCFLSKKQWCLTLKENGFQKIIYSEDDKWNISFTRKLFLHIGSIQEGHFWLTP